MLEELLAEWSNVWLPISVLVIVISFALVAIAWMVGRALANDKIIGWAKDELYQVFGSVIIVGIVVFFLVTANTILLATLSEEGFECTRDGCSFIEKLIRPGSAPGILVAVGATGRPQIDEFQRSCGAEGQDACHFAIAKSKFKSLYDMVRYYGASTIARAGSLAILQDIKITPRKIIKMFGLNIEFKPFAGVGHLVTAYSNMLEIIFMILIIIQANILFLIASEKAIFPLLLISGIALRTLWISRRLGGLLLAIALVLYFMYPMMVIFEALVIMPDPNDFPLTFEDFSDDVGADLQTNVNFLKWNVDLGGGKSTDIISFYIFRTVQKGSILDSTALLSVWILVQQIIVIYVIVISIRELSPFFGGDVQIAGLARLI